MNEQAFEFLKEYRTLCLKYKLALNACDCCHGTWVQEDEDGKLIAEEYEKLTQDIQSDIKMAELRGE